MEEKDFTGIKPDGVDKQKELMAECLKRAKELYKNEDLDSEIHELYKNMHVEIPISEEDNFWNDLKCTNEEPPFADEYIKPVQAETNINDLPVKEEVGISIADIEKRTGLSLDELIRRARKVKPIIEVNSNPIIIEKELSEQIEEYMRVGCDYFKAITVTDRYGIPRKELKVWKKQELLQDKGKVYVETVSKYDCFAIEPDNTETYRPVVENRYNQYSEFMHKPKEGEWIWTEILLRHIFGDQYEQGLRYMQMLYLYPKHQTVILVLVSTERMTGKSTFLEYLNVLFGSNFALIDSKSLTGSFNSFYMTKNIIAIDETFLEKKDSVEKLKALSTVKEQYVNEKYITPYSVPFYGKIVLASNNEDRFALVDKEEVRFFVRKIGKPIFKNNDILDTLTKEIPAFLHYLTTLPKIDWGKTTRSGFTTKEIYNDSLQAVVKESRPTLVKDLELLITDWFSENDQKYLYVTASDIKNRWFQYDSQKGHAYISKVIKEGFGLSIEDNQRYRPFNDNMSASKTGRPYKFDRSDFIGVSHL